MRRMPFFLVLLLSVPFAIGQDADRASSCVQEGSSQLDKGNYEKASRLFEEAYNWQPTFKAAFGAGLCHFKLRRFSEAELWFQKALRIEPDDEQATVYLVSSQVANYKPSQALGLLQDFVRDHPRSVHAAATLEALRADLRPRSFRFEQNTSNSPYLAVGAAVFLLLFFGSFVLPDAGLRAMGRALGWSALTSLLLLFSLPVVLALLGYLWSAAQFFRGWREHRYHLGLGTWARKMRLDLFRISGLFEGKRGQQEERHLLPILKGLVKGGLNKSIVREVEIQLQHFRTDRVEAEAALQRFSHAGKRFRLEVLRLMVSVAVEVGWNSEQEQLLTDIARRLQLQHMIPPLLAELGVGAEKEKSRTSARDVVPQAHPDPLLSCFRLLEVPSNADRSRVKSGYRRQARRYHPDMSAVQPGTAASGDQFHKIREAYQQICKARGWEE